MSPRSGSRRQPSRLRPRMSSRPGKPATPWRNLAGVLWRAPLWAIPFGLFFGVIYGRSSRDFGGAYLGSVVFALSINLCIWSVDEFLRPALLGRDARPGTGRIWQHALLYGGAAVIGAFLAALALHFTIAPNLLGSARSIAILCMYTVLFVLLIGGIIYAARFYRDSIERARSEQELDLARRIQRSFLLSQFPSLPRLEVHAVNVSSKQVSGDFYDVVVAGDEAYLLAIADVAGKGVPAALLSSMLQASLRTQAHDGRPVAEVLRNINTLVYRSTTVEQFATFFLARIEERTLRFSYSNAGHNFPVLFRAGGRRVTLERGGTVVGILETAAFEEEALVLEPGDRIVFYTDGISEAVNAGGEMFGEERLYAAVEALPGELAAREITQRILDAVHGFLDGVEPGDDMTVMVLRVLDPAPAPAAPRG